MTESQSVPLARPADRGLPQDRPAADSARPGRGVTRLMGWLAAAGIGASLLIMAAAALTRQDWMYPLLRLPAGGFPYAATGWHVSERLATAGIWISCLLGGAGVAAGLVAARRGARPPMRLILLAAVAVIALLALVPPAGSTDALDYASYGRLLALGYNPYAVTPHVLRIADPGFGTSVPYLWQDQVSLYGPAATFEQYLAARLGGDSPARIVAWLKLWNLVPFLAVAAVADRTFRRDPARRLRAHLLWTVNPLLIWDLVAAGHLDVLAAGVGVLGLLAVGPQAARTRESLLRAAVAGVMVGLAADIKIDYLAFGVGVAWALRRRPAALLTAGAGALAVLAPTFAWFGLPAIKALFAQRNATTVDSPYRLIGVSTDHSLGLLAALLVAWLAVLLLWRLPAGDPLRPALRPALALTLAWLFIWPYQLPWYDAMVVCLLLFIPASRLDWLVILGLTAASLANMPGNPQLPPGKVLTWISLFSVHTLAPAVLIACAAGLLALVVTGRWGLRAGVPRSNVGS
jgi:hypothetical protein